VYDASYQEVNHDLRILGIGITNRCGLKCDFCSRFSGPEDTTDLGLEKVIEIIEGALRVARSSLVVSITGGEPVLHPEFKKICRHLSGYPIALSLNSNGLQITAELIKFCIDNGILNFSISMDGPPEVYRRMGRPHRIFDKICENISTIRRLGGTFNIGCTMTPHNVNHIGQVAQIARDHGAIGLRISRVYPIGRGLENFNTLFIGWSRFKQVAQEALSYEDSDFFVDIEDNVVRHLYDDAYIEARSCDPKSNAGGWNGCFAGVVHAQVEASGLVLPCAFMPMPAGNIYERTFDNIWLHSPVMKDMRRRDLLKGACGSCQDKMACGGCRGRAFGLHGDYFAEDPLCPRSKDGAESVPSMR
jgi:radical SAM protein with 4Fe4S-binding SPASM domain